MLKCLLSLHFPRKLTTFHFPEDAQVSFVWSSVLRTDFIVHRNIHVPGIEIFAALKRNRSTFEIRKSVTIKNPTARNEEILLSFSPSRTVGK